MIGMLGGAWLVKEDKSPDEMSERVRASVTATVELYCTSARDGKPCVAYGKFVTTDTGVDPLASARGYGWTFYRGAARCRECGRAAASFGKAVR